MERKTCTSCNSEKHMSFTKNIQNVEIVTLKEFQIVAMIIKLKYYNNKK